VLSYLPAFLLGHTIYNTRVDLPVKAAGIAVSYGNGLRRGPSENWGCANQARVILKDAQFNGSIDAIALESTDMCGKFVLVENASTGRRLHILQLGIIGKDCAKGNQICLTVPAAKLLELRGKGDDLRGYAIVRALNGLYERLGCLFTISGVCISIRANMN
jgi:hypothetical protein